ncbi:hypothetical protein VCRA2122O340_50035 [Vibrio crassostreae]|nr:hypothetical protein VCRA2122O340_50035 [Vibrio crassostreae]CAK3958853.1 hypothetical protein VCRA2128O346_50035 [Vibrio crassostreae]
MISLTSTTGLKGMKGMTGYDRVDEVMGVKLGGKTGTGQEKTGRSL